MSGPVVLNERATVGVPPKQQESTLPVRPLGLGSSSERNGLEELDLVWIDPHLAIIGSGRERGADALNGFLILVNRDRQRLLGVWIAQVKSGDVAGTVCRSRSTLERLLTAALTD